MGQAGTPQVTDRLIVDVHAHHIADDLEAEAIPLALLQFDRDIHGGFFGETVALGQFLQVARFAQDVDVVIELRRPFGIRRGECVEEDGVGFGGGGDEVLVPTGGGSLSRPTREPSWQWL